MTDVISHRIPGRPRTRTANADPRKRAAAATPGWIPAFAGGDSFAVASAFCSAELERARPLLGRARTLQGNFLAAHAREAMAAWQARA